MAFDPTNAVVIVVTNLPAVAGGSPGEIAIGTGVMISPTEVLTSSHVLWSSDAQVSATEVNIYTGGSIIYDDDTASFTGSIFAGGSWHYNTITETDGELDADNIAKDFGSVLLTEPATLPDTGSPTGYVGLLDDATFIENGGSGTQYGYPEPEGGTGTSTQQQYEETFTDYSTDDSYYNYFETSSTNGPGMSGGPNLTTLAGAYVAAAVQSGTDADGNSYLAALTPTAIGQIEYWLAQDGQSPAVQRLYEGLLGRLGDSGGLSSWSSMMATNAQEFAEAQGIPYAASADVMLAYPEIAEGFLGSTEFQSAHPDISDSDLVTLLYNQALGRAPDSPGYDNWMDQLTSGAMTQAQVAGAFVNSPEAIAHSGTWGQQ